MLLTVSRDLRSQTYIRTPHLKAVEAPTSTLKYESEHFPAADEGTESDHGQRRMADGGWGKTSGGGGGEKSVESLSLATGLV